MGVYVVQIVNFRGHLTSTLWPSSISGNCDKFQEIFEFIPGNVFLSCGNTENVYHYNLHSLCIHLQIVIMII